MHYRVSIGDKSSMLRRKPHPPGLGKVLSELCLRLGNLSLPCGEYLDVR